MTSKHITFSISFLSRFLRYNLTLHQHPNAPPRSSAYLAELANSIWGYRQVQLGVEVKIRPDKKKGRGSMDGPPIV